jgi:hypothetical protein
MRRTYWPKRRQRNRLDATSVLRGEGKMRGNPLGDGVALAERLVIMHELVKRL